MLKKNSWTPLENRQYVKFFNSNIHFADNAKLRKSKHIFNRLHKHIPTRSPAQIKSRHQKLLLKFSNIRSIIKNLEDEFNNVENDLDEDKQEA